MAWILMVNFVLWGAMTVVLSWTHGRREDESDYTEWSDRLRDRYVLPRGSRWTVSSPKASGEACGARFLLAAPPSAPAPGRRPRRAAASRSRLSPAREPHPASEPVRFSEDGGGSLFRDFDDGAAMQDLVALYIDLVQRPFLRRSC